MKPDHIVKAYDKELEGLGRRIAEMGGIAEKMLSDAMDASCGFDIDLAKHVVDSDPASTSCSARSRKRRS